ncbi:MAG: helix-turn-helix domain-containing protein [Myxococcaceae bacterium]
MARSVRVPLHVIKSKISASAKMLWIELALTSSPKRPQVSVVPKALAEKLGRSKATIGRLIAELQKAELIVHTGFINRFHKTYNLVWIVKKPEEIPVLLAPTLKNIPVELHPEVERICKESANETEFHGKLMAFLKLDWEMKQNGLDL